MEHIDWRDLVPVAKLGDDLILFVLEEDVDSANALCIQVNFVLNKFYPAQNIQLYLKFNPFEQVDWRDKNVRFMYHDMIQRRFSKKAIIDMIQDMSLKHEKYK